MEFKKISVIIPVTRPKKAKLAKASVLKQKKQKTSLEVILVPSKGMTAGQARNLGANRAKGEVLLFLDDDCQAKKGWLEENLKALADSKVGAVGAMVLPKSKKYFSRCLDFANFSLSQIPILQKRIISATSLGVRKKVFQKIGGFDENLKVKEDTDFCYRLLEKNYYCLYQPKIKIVHDHGRHTLKKLLVYQYYNGYWSGLTVEKRYPKLSFSSGLGKINKFLVKIKNPWLYAIFVFPLSFLGTVLALTKNLFYWPEIIFCLPFVFLGKLATHLGIFICLIEERQS